MAGSARAYRYVVSGRVQGVFYRDSTRERALGLGLSGWVRNLPEGGVEVVVAGEAEAVAELAAWLWEGPRGASVSGVEVGEFTDAIPEGFSVVR